MGEIYTGNNITIDTTGNKKAKITKINGGDKQETREGYNLLDTSKLSTGTSNGIEKQINKENGKIILNGTTTLLTNCWIDNLNKTLVPGTYKFITDFDLILNSENIGAYVIKDVDGNNILQTRQSAEFVLEKETILNQVLIQINKGVKLDKQEIGLMIISGTENKNYEQYGAMPSPNYPSKVETVGSNVNLFDKDNANTISGAYVDSSGNIGNGGAKSQTLYIPITGGKTYTVSKKLTNYGAFRIGTTTEIPALNVQGIDVVSKKRNRYKWNNNN